MSEAISRTAAPVVILRWFAEGAGYAYDSTIESPHVSVISEALANVFQTQPFGSPFSLPVAFGGWIVGDKIEDTACLDAKAEGREPAIVRAVLLRERPKPRREKALLERLRTLPLPTHPGPTQLVLALPQAPRIELPYPAQDFPRVLTQWGPAGAALVVVLLEAYLQLDPGFTHSLAAWLGRIGLLASIMAVCYVWAPARASAQDVREVELRLHGSEDDEDGDSSVDSVFSENACIVLPDGRRIDTNTLIRRAASGFGPANLLVADSQYREFLNAPGRATLIGKEKVRWENEAEALCWFIRHYERIRGQWRITFAQWTIMPSAVRLGNDVVLPA